MVVLKWPVAGKMFNFYPVTNIPIVSLSFRHGRNWRIKPRGIIFKVMAEPGKDPAKVKGIPLK